MKLMFAAELCTEELQKPHGVGVRFILICSDLPTDTSALLSRIHPTGDPEGTEKTEKRLTDGVRASTQTAWIQIPSATSLEPEPPHSYL